jgi:hypothetical protein
MAVCPPQGKNLIRRSALGFKAHPGDGNRTRVDNWEGCRVWFLGEGGKCVVSVERCGGWGC